MTWLAADLTLYIAAGVLLLSGVWLGWWSLFGDRARGRRRCPKCWYDLRGTPGMRCSECGFEAKRERQLHRSRRRWRWTASAGGLIIAAFAFAVWPSVRAGRPLRWAPTRILLWVAPMGERLAAGGGVLSSLAAAPLSELTARDNGDEFSLGDWRFVVANSGLLRMRTRWPRNVPFVFEIAKPSWISRDIGIDELTPHARELPSPYLFGDPNVHAFAAPTATLCDAAAWTVTGRIAMRVGVYAPRPGWLTPSSRVATFEIERTVTLVDSVDVVLQPVDDERLDRLLRDALTAHVSLVRALPKDDVMGVQVWLWLNWTSPQEFANVAAPMQVEIVFRDLTLLQAAGCATRHSSE